MLWLRFYALLNTDTVGRAISATCSRSIINWTGGEKRIRSRPRALKDRRPLKSIQCRKNAIIFRFVSVLVTPIVILGYAMNMKTDWQMNCRTMDILSWLFSFTLLNVELEGMTPETNISVWIYWKKEKCLWNWSSARDVKQAKRNWQKKKPTNIFWKAMWHLAVSNFLSFRDDDIFFGHK